jgi:putative hemin transport protein
MEMNTMTLSTSLEPRLREVWQEFRSHNPQVRVRDAARVLGVSEAELVATGCGREVVRLRKAWRSVLGALPTLGPVMALARHEHAVHEKTGVVERIEEAGPALQVSGGIALRLRIDRWSHGFAVHEETAQGPRHSLQFFDASGCAVQKIYLTGETDRAAFEALVHTHRHIDQSPGLIVARHARRVGGGEAGALDKAGLHAAWPSITDTNLSEPLSARLGLSRARAYRRVGAERAQSIEPFTFRALLYGVAEEGRPVSVQVASPAALQSHTGPIRNLKLLGPWFNVLDADFNLHLHEPGVASAWIVRPQGGPDAQAWVELLDDDGELICRLASAAPREPGHDARWAELLESLVDASAL